MDRRKVMGVGQKSKEFFFPRKLLIKNIFQLILAKKICPRRICVGKTITDQLYEVNDKSRLEIKRDFCNVTTLIDTVVGQTLKLKSSTFYMYYLQIFTDQTTRNFLE